MRGVKDRLGGDLTQPPKKTLQQRRDGQLGIKRRVHVEPRGGDTDGDSFDLSRDRPLTGIKRRIVVGSGNNEDNVESAETTTTRSVKSRLSDNVEPLMTKTKKKSSNIWSSSARTEPTHAVPPLMDQEPVAPPPVRQKIKIKRAKPKELAPEGKLSSEMKQTIYLLRSACLSNNNVNV